MPKTPIEKFQKWCEDLAIAFMEKKDPDLFELSGEKKYKLWSNGEFFIGSNHTDYGAFSDGSDYYVWSLEDMYTVIRDDIPYDILTEWFDWWYNDTWLFSDHKRPDGWVNLEHYWILRRWHEDKTADQFQRMVQRECYDNLSRNLTDEQKEKDEKYLSDSLEKFKKDNNL